MKEAIQRKDKYSLGFYLPYDELTGQFNIGGPCRQAGKLNKYLQIDLDPGRPDVQVKSITPRTTNDEKLWCEGVVPAYKTPSGQGYVFMNVVLDIEYVAAERWTPDVLQVKVTASLPPFYEESAKGVLALIN